MDTLRKRTDAARLKLDPDGLRTRRLPRPFMVELFGTPKAGKSTIKEMLKHFFRRSGWKVTAPIEGAEVVELPRDEPQYNFQTCEYAMMAALDRSYGNAHVAIFDRAIFDGVVRMEYYRRKGVITAEEQATYEGYFLKRSVRELFDLHICLVSSPEVAIERELVRALIKEHGQTMNPKTLRGLLDAHQAVRDRFEGSDVPFVWHDSSAENEDQTAKFILSAVLDAFERRIIA